MAKYRRKPNIVDAFKWTGGPDQTVDPEWIIDCLKSGMARICRETEEYGYYDEVEPRTEVIAFWMEIETLAGTMRADPGDYIIRGKQGNIYPCKPGIFETNHEIIEDDND